jgi:hypothetical protein
MILFPRTAERHSGLGLSSDDRSRRCGGIPNGFFISSACIPLPEAGGPGRTILFFTPTLLSLVDKY